MIIAMRILARSEEDIALHTTNEKYWLPLYSYTVNDRCTDNLQNLGCGYSLDRYRGSQSHWDIHSYNRPNMNQIGGSWSLPASLEFSMAVSELS